MGMKKLLEVGVKKFGSISALHRELVRSGIDVSLPTIQALLRIEKRGDFTRKLYSALNTVLHDGDWTKTGKLIDKE